VHLQLRELPSLKSESGTAGQQVKNLEAELAKLREEMQSKHAEHASHTQTFRGNVDTLSSKVNDVSQNQSKHLKELGELTAEFSTHSDKLNKATSQMTNVQEVAKAVENALRAEINDIKEQCKSGLAAETSDIRMEIEKLKQIAAGTAAENEKARYESKETLDKIYASLEKLEESKRELHELAAKDRLTHSHGNAKLAENIEKLNESVISDIQQAVSAESQNRFRAAAAEKAAREKDVAVLQATLKDVLDKVKTMEDETKKQSSADVLRQAFTPELQRLTSKTTEIDTNLGKLDRQLSESKKQQESIYCEIDKRVAFVESGHSQHRELTLQSFKDIQVNFDASKKTTGQTDSIVIDIQAQLEYTKTSMNSLKQQMDQVASMLQKVNTLSNDAIRDGENRAKDQDDKIEKISIEMETSQQAILVKVGKNSERLDLLRASIDDEMAARCKHYADLQAKISQESSAIRQLIDSMEQRPVPRDINLDASVAKDIQATLGKEKDGIQQALQSVREKMDKLNSSRDDTLNELRLHKDDVNKRFVEVHQKQTDIRRKISDTAVKSDSLQKDLLDEIDSRIQRERALSEHLTKGIDEERSSRAREMQQTRRDVIAAVERERQERVKENTEQRTTLTKALRQLKISIDDDDDRSWFFWGSRTTATKEEKTAQTDEDGIDQPQKAAISGQSEDSAETHPLQKLATNLQSKDLAEPHPPQKAAILGQSKDLAKPSPPQKAAISGQSKDVAESHSPQNAAILGQSKDDAESEGE